MPDDKQILLELFKGTALVVCEGSANKPRVTLLEPDAPDSTAAIRDLPSDALIIKVDLFRSPDALFNGEKGECKRADYIIISTQKKHIVYIEMKRTKALEHHITKQLIGAQCFLKYCQEIGKAFWKEENFLNDYQHRFVSIGHTSISKKTTRVMQSANSNSSPDKALKISWPKNIQYNMLIGV